MFLQKNNTKFVSGSRRGRHPDRVGRVPLPPDPQRLRRLPPEGEVLQAEKVARVPSQPAHRRVQEGDPPESQGESSGDRGGGHGMRQVHSGPTIPP